MFLNCKNKIIKTIMKGAKYWIERGTLGTTSYRNTEQHFYVAWFNKSFKQKAQVSLLPYVKIETSETSREHWIYRE